MTIRTTVVVAACLGALAGTLAASFLWARDVLLSAALVTGVGVGCAILALEVGSRHRAVIVAVIIGAWLGAVRTGAALPRTRDAAPLPSGTVTLEGRVARADGRMVVLVGTALTSARIRTPVALGRPVALWVPDSVDLAYGSTIRARCGFTPSAHPRERAARAGRCSVWSPADLRVLASGGGSPTFRRIFALRDALLRSVGRVLSEPAASLVAGVTIGVDRRLPDAIMDAFRRTGTVHILVVSGWQMTLIGLSLRRTLTRIGLPRPTALLLAGLLLAGFTVMAGMQPAAVRGALTVAAFLAVDALGRVGNPLRTLLLVATAMVLVHPRVLAFDLGFQLSFSATVGIFLGAPIIERAITRAVAMVVAFPVLRWLRQRLRARPGGLRAQWGAELRALVAASTAASIATAPFLLHAFGTVALLAPLVNIPVLLILHALMGAGALAAAMGTVSAALAAPFAWGATVLSDAMVGIVVRASALPWTSLPQYAFDAWFLAGMSALLVIATLAWHRRSGVALLSPFTVLAQPSPPPVLPYPPAR